MKNINSDYIKKLVEIMKGNELTEVELQDLKDKKINGFQHWNYILL